MGLFVGWAGPEIDFRMVARAANQGERGHAVVGFADNGALLAAHRGSPFDVVVLRTTEPSDPLSANRVLAILRAESPGTTVALCSGCRVEAAPGEHGPCSGGIRVAHDADPDLFDRFFPKGGVLWRGLVAWLDGLESARVAGRG